MRWRRRGGRSHWVMSTTTRISAVSGCLSMSSWPGRTGGPKSHQARGVSAVPPCLAVSGLQIRLRMHGELASCRPPGACHWRTGYPLDPAKPSRTTSGAKSLDDTQVCCGCCTLVLHAASSSRRHTFGLAGGCQRRSAPDPGQTVRECLLASTAVGGDLYSLGYSVARPAIPAIAGQGD